MMWWFSNFPSQLHPINIYFFIRGTTKLHLIVTLHCLCTIDSTINI